MIVVTICLRCDDMAPETVLTFIVIVFVTHFYNEVKVWYKVDDARLLVVDGLINKPKDLRI